jgi:hypothetical protein
VACFCCLSIWGGKNYLSSMSWVLPKCDSLRHRNAGLLGPTQLSIQWVPGVLSPGVKRPGREADHSFPVSAEVNKTWGVYIHSTCLHDIVHS